MGSGHQRANRRKAEPAARANAAEQNPPLPSLERPCGWQPLLHAIAPGIALTATVGAGFTAQIGAMRVSEEIDAVEVMAIPSIPFLVSTRVIASSLAVIPLYFVGLIGTYAATQAVSILGLEIQTVYLMSLGISVAMMAGFAWFYLRPVRGALAVLFVVALAAGSVEASLYLLMGWFVDILARSGPETLWQDHGTGLVLAAALILVARPVLSWLHEALSNQLVVPQTTGLIRWRTHLYTLGHALSYFQADFAGRLANASHVTVTVANGGGTFAANGVTNIASLSMGDQSILSVALDKTNGKELWRMKREESSNWSTPLPSDMPVL